MSLSLGGERVSIDASPDFHIFPNEEGTISSELYVSLCCPSARDN